MDERVNPMLGVTVEKARLNLWNAVGFAVGIGVTAFGWGITYNTAVNNDARAQEQIQAVREDVSDIKDDLPVIPQLQFEVSSIREQATENRTAIEVTNTNVNNRIDRVVESFGGKLDTLVDNVNKLNTQVQVLTSRVEQSGSGSFRRRNSSSQPQ